MKESEEADLAASTANEEENLSKRKLSLLRSTALRSAITKLKHEIQRFATSVEMCTRILGHVLPGKYTQNCTTP